MQKLLTFALSCALLAASASAQMEASAPSQLPDTPTADGKAKLLREAALPLTPYSYFGYSTEQINKAYNSGLRRTDLTLYRQWPDAASRRQLYGHHRQRPQRRPQECVG